MFGVLHTQNAEASGHEEVADDSEGEVNFFTEGDGDEDGEEGQDEEEEAGHGAGGGLLHDYGEEEGEHTSPGKCGPERHPTPNFTLASFLSN